jgi:hypothetical protein
MPERLRAPALLIITFVLVGAVYAATNNDRGITDTTLNGLQTRALVLHGDVDLTRYRLDLDEFQGPGGNLVIQRGDRQYSVYGVGVSLAGAPIYAVLARTGTSERARQAVVAILFTAGAAALMSLVLLRVATPAVALLCLVVFAFGTTAWPVAAMAFFQQGPVLFFEALGLLGLVASTPARPGLTGLAFGTATLIRPTAGIPFALIGLLQLIRGRSRIAWYLAGATVPLLILIVQNRWIWGSWLEGGYSHIGVPFGAPFRSALSGLTIGWWRGLLVYSPFLVLAIAGCAYSIRREGERERAFAFLGISIAVTLMVYSKWSDWGGGINQFGYRLQLEMVPFLIVLTAVGVARLRRAAPVALGTAAISVATMTLGAAPRRDAYDDVLFAHRIQDSSLWRSWSAFIDRPWSGIARLALVVGASGLIIVASLRIAGATTRTPRGDR